MKSSGSCDQCRKAVAENDIPKTVKPTGESVVIRTSIGRGHDQTDHEFTQCAECGSIWLTIVDSGAGGHGRFHHCLTRKFF
jgi:hypothetical protein